MKRSTIFLQIVTVLIGIGAALLLLWEPPLEGRNVNSKLYEIYFNDPFLAYVYISSIPFFAVLYQKFKLLGFARENEIFTQEAVIALQKIKYLALTIIAFAVVGIVIILLSISDDHTGGLFISTLIIIGSLVIGAVAEMFERILYNVLDKNSDRIL